MSYNYMHEAVVLASYYFWAEIVLISYMNNTMLEMTYIEECVEYLFDVKSWLFISNSQVVLLMGGVSNLFSVVPNPTPKAAILCEWVKKRI